MSEKAQKLERKVGTSGQTVVCLHVSMKLEERKKDGGSLKMPGWRRLNMTIVEKVNKLKNPNVL